MKTLTLSLLGLLASSLSLAAETSGTTGASFVDPTASVTNARQIALGENTYVGPFAVLKAGTTLTSGIVLGKEVNIQDNVTLDATGGRIVMGDLAIAAHGATLKSKSQVGVGGSCPGGAKHCASFVGFNSEVDGATVQMDAMVTHLARVAPGLVVPSGCKVMPGKLITSQAQMGVAGVCRAPYTTPVTEADREFMKGVIEVNVCFANQYAAMRKEDPSLVSGINADPSCGFNPGRQLPRFAGSTVQDSGFRNRIIGDVRMADELEDADDRMGAQVALRADEGSPFTLGANALIDSKVVMHALEHTKVTLGANAVLGRRALVHGGPAFGAHTQAGNGLSLGKEAVFFQSTAGAGVKLGCRAFVQATQLAAYAQVPSRAVIIGGVQAGTVEWGTCP
ncbi:MAG: hypothetical protein E6Q92_02875 [Burkholderiaceae bacterium]|nr:MAG: hypothetical protein E6Q92_02875 [Burkholderiaceae bacterium]